MVHYSFPRIVILLPARYASEADIVFIRSFYPYTRRAHPSEKRGN